MSNLKKEKNNNEEKKEVIDSKELTVKKKKRKIFQKFINMIKSKILINGVATILLIAIIIDIYILVNIGLQKVVLPEFDSTENKIHTLSEETKTKLKNLDSDTAITFINFENYMSAISLAEKYTLLNNKIKVERIDDLSSRKDLMEKYSLDTTSEAIIISSGENETILGDYDLYTYDYLTYETIDTTEEALTNAIINVTTKDKPKIYFMNTHTAYNVDYYFYMLIQLMEEDANEVATLDILSAGSVPEDCDTLVITTLSEDITTFEKDKILEYINKGGEILLLNGPNLTEKQLTNFQEILNQYGITIEEGMIYEGNSANMLYEFPAFIIEKIQSSAITEKLNMNTGIGFLGAASIEFNEEKKEELNVEYEKLITTSSQAFLRKNYEITTSYRTDTDSEEAEFVIGGIVNKKIDENNDSKLIIFGNELFASNMTLEEIMGTSTSSGALTYIVGLYHNADVVLNSIAYLNEREDIITIRKSYDSVTYTATQLEHNIIMAIIFITPLIIIIIGVIVWQYRRKR